MGKDKIPNEDKIIEDLEKPSEEVEVREIPPGVDIEKELHDREEAKRKEKEKTEPEKPEETIKNFTNAFVGTMDNIQNKVCMALSKTDDRKKYRYDDDEKNEMFLLWLPVVAKWYEKIPIEVIAIGGTAAILSTKFAAAAKDAKENK